MANAYLDLKKLLISKKEKLTPDETKIIESCRDKALRNFTVSSLVAAAAVWKATGKLRTSSSLQVYLSLGGGFLCGMSMYERSLGSCADHILTLDGSRLQKELANIVVTEYQNDASLMKLISKHFYSERIYDDSTSNTPKLRWRYRNSFSDNAIIGNRTQDHDSYDKSQGYSNSLEKYQGKYENITESKRTTRRTKQILIDPGTDIALEVDPLDSLFGYGATVDEIFHPNTTNKPSTRHHRSHRRYHRRRRDA